jgi:hypothetical protein
MTETALLAERALGHIEHLVAGIGPRPAGSEREAAAMEYIEYQLAKTGLEPNRETVKFAPHPTFNPLYGLVGLLVVLAGWSLDVFPWLGLVLPILVAGLPQISRGLIRLRPARAQSLNVTAGAEKPGLILCAHVDSGPAAGWTWAWAQQLSKQTMYYAQRVAVLLAGLALLVIIGFEFPPVILSLAAILGSAVGAWMVVDDLMNQPGMAQHYSPGAVDNASGVAVMLAVAEYLSTQTAEKQGMLYLFTGAEETGMHGAQSFIEAHPELREVPVLNLDMVAAGDQLVYVSGDGTLRPRRTSKKVNEWIVLAEPFAQPAWYTLRSGDFLPFLQAGWQAGSIEMCGSSEAETAYHTREDTLEKVDVETLERVIRCILRVIGQVEFLN